jgi:hypothetical protein
VFGPSLGTGASPHRPRRHRLHQCGLSSPHGVPGGFGPSTTRQGPTPERGERAPLASQTWPRGSRLVRVRRRIATLDGEGLDDVGDAPEQNPGPTAPRSDDRIPAATGCATRSDTPPNSRRARWPTRATLRVSTLGQGVDGYRQEDGFHLAGQPGLEFVVRVPATWDETRALNAAVGERIVVARRKGGDWNFGGMTAARGRGHGGRGGIAAPGHRT